jgi:nucleotide-binding universal stress UspA family protein
MSSFKSILVHLKAYEEWPPAAETAIDLAKRYDATLTGLYTIRELAMIKLIFGADHRAVREAEARDAPLTEGMKQKFLDACTRAGVMARFDVGEGNANELLSFAGRCHDLVVIQEAVHGIDAVGKDAAEECAVTCGTPTLIVPKSGSYLEIGKSIAIGWNHSRQAAVALRGALPFISRAKKVVVFAGDERDAMTSVTKRPDADIVAFLRKYCDEVDTRKIDGSGEASGATLQSAAINAGADLLVMGAYGRSSWREFVFGGTTRDVMRSLRLPGLMGH